MPGQEHAGPLTALSGEVLALHRRVRFDGTNWDYADDEIDHGTVIQPANTSGDYFTVKTPNAEGTDVMVAAGAISAGADVYAAADGKVAATGNHLIGKALEAATANNDWIEVLRVAPHGVGVPVYRSKILSIDCEDGASNADTVLIPAAWNLKGLIILGIYARVSEQFAGGTEDQGVVTVSDESDNALGTLTPSDAGADAVGDVVAGTQPVLGASTGAVTKSVAAGELVDLAVTQATSGTGAAGKMSVFVLYTPLI